jgi:hypothetical protein
MNTPPIACKLQAPDDFYQALLDTHQGLSLAASHALNARLVLILANEVGDLDTLRAALRAARDDAQESTP